MDIDEALAKVGGYRRWHLVTFSLISLALCMPLAWQGMAIVFIGWDPPHHCKVPEGRHFNDTIPMIRNKYGEYTPHRCRMYSSLNTTNDTEPCTEGWTYLTEVDHTIVMEWDLVCSRNFLSELSQTLYQVGALCGELLTAVLLDRIGRKKVFITCLLLAGAVGTGLSFTKTYLSFVIVRTLIAVPVAASALTGLIIVMEMFDSSKRAFAGIGLETFWVINYVLLPLMAYYLRDWRHLELTISAVVFVWIIFIWIIPESPLWLAANKRYNEADEILQKMARYNGVKTGGRLLQKETDDSRRNKKKKKRNESVTAEEEDVELNPVPEDKELETAVEVVPRRLGGKKKHESKADQLRFKDLFCDRHMLKHTVISMLLWFANSIVYYALILSTPTLAGDRYINFLMSALVEIPAYILTYILCFKVGRRLSTCVFHVLAGVFLVMATVIPPQTGAGVSLAPVVTTMALLGKFAISVSFAIIILYTKELFPTNLRGTSGGICNILGRAGNMAAPFAVYAAKSTPWLPSTILAIISITVGLIALTLPETRDCVLPQDIQDVHDMYRPADRRRRSSVAATSIYRKSQGF